jgi:hypothetical protein
MRTVLGKTAGLFRRVTGAGGRPMNAVPGIPRFGGGKSLKTAILASLLLLLPAFFLGAQQSFFIAPGTEIKNGEIARGYCLEYTQKRLSNDNIAGLLHNIEGAVRVVYTNREPENLKLQDLVNNGLVRFNAFDSYQHLQFLFAGDSGITALVTGEDGLSLFRDGISEDENRLARKNIDAIRSLEGKLEHSAIQKYIWRTRLPLDIPAKDGVRIIDLRTTADPSEQVHARFGGNATVDYRRNRRIFMRLDGILNGTEDFSPEITELVSHFHNDHISYAALENLLETGNFADLFAPYAYLDSAKNRIFDLLEKAGDRQEYKFKQENRILEITGADRPFTPVHTGSIGDFYYTAFNYDADIQITLFKYKKPKNPNKDGMICQIIHNNASYLLFGDFDDPGGIENLLGASAENEKKLIELEELYSALEKHEYEYEDTENLIDAFYSGIFFGGDEEFEPDDETRNRIAVLENHLRELENTIYGLEERIDGLEAEIKPLPALQADIVKWPHHAHAFSRELIEKMNAVINPRYFIYQAHRTQEDDPENPAKFKAMIESLDFKDKFINSAEYDVEIISLYFLRVTDRYYPLAQTLGGLIYKITHGDVSQVQFGYFDDEKALTELVEHSKANGEKRIFTEVPATKEVLL